VPLYIDCPLRHLDHYRISYRYTLHLYPLAAVCNLIRYHTSAVKHWRTCPDVIFHVQLSDTCRSRRYTRFTPNVKTHHNRQERNTLRHFYHESSTIPPTKAARGRLNLASTGSRTENQRSPISRVTPILIQAASIMPEDEIHYEDDYDNKENTAEMDDVKSYGAGDNLRKVLGDNPSEPKPTTQSEIVSM
jgi:hypothetical protein